jgi:hypothetical protein
MNNGMVKARIKCLDEPIGKYISDIGISVIGKARVIKFRVGDFAVGDTQQVISIRSLNQIDAKDKLMSWVRCIPGFGKFSASRPEPRHHDLENGLGGDVDSNDKDENKAE